MSSTSPTRTRPTAATISGDSWARSYCLPECRLKNIEKTQTPHQRFSGAVETVRQAPSGLVCALAAQMPPATLRRSQKLATGMNHAPTAQPGLMDCRPASNTSALSRTLRNQRMKSTAVAMIA